MSDKSNPKKALYLAGQMSDLVRRLTGGLGVNGEVTARSVTELSNILVQLKKVVDQYDAEILSMM